jgi:hypothetical protein
VANAGFISEPGLGAAAAASCKAPTEAFAALDGNFFQVRFDRLAPSEKKYLRAIADGGPGPHRSGEIAEELGRSVQSLGPTRAGLIAKGMI